MTSQEIREKLRAKEGWRYEGRLQEEIQEAILESLLSILEILEDETESTQLSISD